MTAKTTTSPDSFSARLRRLREERGLTQQEVSKASGLSQSTVSALETGKQRPWPSTRRSLARAFEMSIEDLDQRTIGAGTAMTDAVSSQSLATALAQAPRSEAGDAVLRLLTKLHNLEDRLGRTQQELGLLRRVIDMVPVLLWTTDTTGVITSASGWSELRFKAWAQTVGSRIGDRPAEHATGASGDDGVVLPADAHHRALQGETVAINDTWAGMPVSLVIEPVTDGSGRLTGTMGVAVRIGEP